VEETNNAMSGSSGDLSVNPAEAAVHDEGARAELDADILHMLRFARNVSQADVAHTLNVSQEWVRAFEGCGVARAPIGCLRSYIRALGGYLRVEVYFGGQRIEIT
jgi:DNA-binding transcriptional regulator YiaG